MAVTAMPRNQNAHITIGMLHKARYDYSRALMAWSVVLIMDPRENSTHAQVAHVLLLTGDDRRAEFYLSKAIELNPNLSDAYASRVAALAHLGRDDEARTSYAAMRQRFPAWDVDHQLMKASDRETMARFIACLDRVRRAEPERR